MQTDLGDAESAPLLDRAVIEELRINVGDEQLLALLGILPEESAKCLYEIKNALSQGDLEGARRFAHRLKGAAGNFGAKRLEALACGLELEAETLEAAGSCLPALDEAFEQTRRALAAIV